MANPEHVERLVESTAEQWNAWRAEHPDEKPDLSGIALSKEYGATPHGSGGRLMSLWGRNLRDASFVATDFRVVNVGNADFTGADIDCAWWSSAGISRDAAPAGLDEPLRKLDNERCDRDCRQYWNDSYPNKCARRCSDVLSPDQEHVARLLDGVEAWNAWRDANPRIWPDLSGLDVHRLFEVEKGIDKREAVDLSDINLEYATLRGTEFQEVRLDRTTCRGADLRCSEWYGVETIGSNFVGADFRNAKMHFVHLDDSDFTSAKTSGLRIEGVRLPGANLQHADLRGSSFRRSDLSMSDLSWSHVCGSTLAGANLRGAKLYTSRIWKANLFKEEDIIQFYREGINHERAITSVESLFQALSDARSLGFIEPGHTYDASTANRVSVSSCPLFYRGQGNHRWPLRPTVSRSRSYIQHEAELISELTTRHPDEFRNDTVFFQHLVRARHFELPTRLLDVTSNPLTALYYASERTPWDQDGSIQIFGVNPRMVYPFDSDTVSLIANFTRLSYEQQRALLTSPLHYGPEFGSRTDDERDLDRDVYGFAMRRLIHFIAREKPYWEERIRPVDFFKVLLVKPESSFMRLKAHDGAFLISAFHHDFSPSEVNGITPGAGKYARVVYRVPHGAKKRIRAELAAAGVSEESLRSDLGSAAKAVADEIDRRPAPRPPRWWES